MRGREKLMIRESVQTEQITGKAGVLSYCSGVNVCKQQANYPVSSGANPGAKIRLLRRLSEGKATKHQMSIKCDISKSFKKKYMLSG